MHTALLVLKTATELKKAASRLFKEYELSPAQFNVLNLLALHEPGMCAGDLAEQLLVDPSNVTGLLRRLTKEGMIQEGETPDDGRRRVVKLTTKGRNRRDRAHKAYVEALDRVEASLSSGEKTATERALIKIQEHCDEFAD